MIIKRSPPPEAEACLCRRYASSQKGGTLIRAEVADLETHEHWLTSGRYRPKRCPRCGSPMHVHDRRRRVLLAGPTSSSQTEVARFRCANRDCHAIWQVLPAFLARHLWRAWQVVEKAAWRDRAEVDEATTEIPERTCQRWRARLASSARVLVALLGTAGSAALDAVAAAVGLDGTRRELAGEYADRFGARRGEQLAVLAEHIHRFARGVRLM